MNAKELTTEVEGLKAKVEDLLTRSAAAHTRVTGRLAAQATLIKLLTERCDRMEALLEARTRVISRPAAAAKKVGNHAQWMAAIAALKAANVEPALGAGMFDAETQVVPEMLRLFPTLAGAPAPAPAPVEAKAPMAPVPEEDTAEDEAMF